LLTVSVDPKGDHMLRDCFPELGAIPRLNGISARAMNGRRVYPYRFNADGYSSVRRKNVVSATVHDEIRMKVNETLENGSACSADYVLD
jgi:hypothetical protein